MARPCGHEQRLERMTVDPFDFRTLHLAGDPNLNMRAPITNASAVEVYFKGTLVPRDHPVYGYVVVSDPDRIQENYTFSKIVFNHPVRLIRPLIEVNYITRRGFCLECNGNGNVNDWTVSPAGSLTHVVDNTKLAQQSLKYILTSKNPFTPTLICHLKDYIGKQFGFDVTTSDISATVQQALESFMQIQAAQKTVQTMSPQETLREVVSVIADSDPNTPFVIYVSVVVTGYGTNTPIPLNIALQSG
jgi:hypothetical protein